MTHSTPLLSHDTPAPGAWELDLWAGAAWFSDWFYQKLQWPAHTGSKTLYDLQPHLAAGSWDLLLLGIREHLELKKPLDVELCLQLAQGRIEWWHMQGSTEERNTVGHPVHLAGSMHDVTGEPRRGAAPTTHP